MTPPSAGPGRAPVPGSSQALSDGPPFCASCGTELEILREPLKRLRWSRHWLKGASSLFSQPLRLCTTCGSLYDENGSLVAAGAAETEVELRTTRFRNDMIGLRDGFGAVVVGAGMTVAWTLAGPITYDPAVTILAGSVGVLALAPFGYFLAKVRKIKRELKTMRKTRKERGAAQ